MDKSNDGVEITKCYKHLSSYFYPLGSFALLSNHPKRPSLSKSKSLSVQL